MEKLKKLRIKLNENNQYKDTKKYINSFNFINLHFRNVCQVMRI